MSDPWTSLERRRTKVLEQFQGLGDLRAPVPFLRSFIAVVNRTVIAPNPTIPGTIMRKVHGKTVA